MKAFEESDRLRDFFNVISVTADRDGSFYASTMEAQKVIQACAMKQTSSYVQETTCKSIRDTAGLRRALDLVYKPVFVMLLQRVCSLAAKVHHDERGVALGLRRLCTDAPEMC